MQQLPGARRAACTGGAASGGPASPRLPRVGRARCSAFDVLEFTTSPPSGSKQVCSSLPRAAAQHASLGACSTSLRARHQARSWRRSSALSRGHSLTRAPAAASHGRSSEVRRVAPPMSARGPLFRGVCLLAGLTCLPAAPARAPAHAGLIPRPQVSRARARSTAGGRRSAPEGACRTLGAKSSCVPYTPVRPSADAPPPAAAPQPRPTRPRCDARPCEARARALLARGGLARRPHSDCVLGARSRSSPSL
jgi:hypothetical protein